jgi:phosphinothricin acetyltransferase
MATVRAAVARPASAPMNLALPACAATFSCCIAASAVEDVDALLALRNHYIAHSFATFDEAPLTPAAVRDWIAGFAATGPHRLLVARDGPRLLGFCSSQAYRAHPAFARTIETSIYVAPGAGGLGVGSALYGRLFAELAGHGLHRAVVGIALPNEASVRLHARFGFRAVGVFDEYAHKNGRAISSLWMQRAMDDATP